MSTPVFQMISRVLLVLTFSDLMAFGWEETGENIPFLIDPLCWSHNGFGTLYKLFMFPQRSLSPSQAFCN